MALTNDDVKIAVVTGVAIGLASLVIIAVTKNIREESGDK